MQIGKIICYGFSSPQSGWRHDNFSGVHRLYHIHGGKGGCIHNGKNYSFLPDHLYLIPYTEGLRLYCDPEEPILHTYMDFELIPSLFFNELLEADPAEEELRAALALFDLGGRQERTEALHTLCVAAVLYLVQALAEKHRIALPTDGVVLKALERMHSGMHEPLTVEQLAKECYMNPDSFIRRFAKAVGCTPYAYLRRLRLNTARRLRGEGLPLEEVARAVGYADGSSLLHSLNKK